MLPWKFWIDTHKGATVVAVLALMAVFDQWTNPTAWVYLGLHGTYGVLWVLKSALFGDRRWEVRVPLWQGLGTWAGLSLYWLTPALITTQNVHAPAWLLGVAVAAYAVGVFLHFASDLQKHVSLRLRPGTLITDGLFSQVRNPNYLGELLIYAGFGSLALSWIPFAVIAAFIVVLWGPNMAAKEKSLARYPEYAAYRARTKLIVPWLL